MDKKLRDISTDEDVEFLVKTFYGRMLQDELMAPHFKDIDFEEHFPRMIAFWSFILLDKAGYSGNVFDKHVHLKINESHFEHWLAHFSSVAHDFFEGEKTDLAKQRAEVLKYTFLSKMKQFPNKS